MAERERIVGAMIASDKLTFGQAEAFAKFLHADVAISARLDCVTVLAVRAREES